MSLRLYFPVRLGELRRRRILAELPPLIKNYSRERRDTPEIQSLPTGWMDIEHAETTPAILRGGGQSNHMCRILTRDFPYDPVLYMLIGDKIFMSLGSEFEIHVVDGQSKFGFPCYNRRPEPLLRLGTG